MLARFTARREGIVLVPYRDGDGWSVGCGHHLGKLETPPTIKITVREAFLMLLDDLSPRVISVTNAIKVPVKAHQIDAVTDLLYQGGSDGYKAVLAIINNRNPNNAQSVLASDREAAREFLNWDTTAAGEHIDGLLKRRARNVAIYCAGDYGSDLDEVPLWDKVDPDTGKVTTVDAQAYKLKPRDLELLKGKRG